MKSPRSKTILAVDLDYFYAQCEETRRPELKDKPVVICVFSGRTEDSGAVSTSNYIARRLGVRSGIPIVNAKRILRDVKDAVLLPMDREYYDSVSERVMEILRSHSDTFEQVSVDEAFLDVTPSTDGDFERAKRIAAETKEAILDREGLTCSIGVASNRLLAKMAADSEKPDGLTVLPPEEVSRFLNDKPIDKLIGVGPKTEKKMNSLGIKTIGDLASFDESKLSEEFGKNLGPQFKRLAQGEDDQPVVERPIEQLSRIITLKEDATSFSFEDETKPLVADIAQRLRSMKLKCKNVGIIAITSSLKTKTRAKTLVASTDLGPEILFVSSQLFRDFFKENIDLRIRRVGIRVSMLGKQEEKVEQPSREPSLTDFL